jgi:predicted lactoylglutathione lyase
MNEPARFVNVCPVFISRDVQRTAQFYTEKLGFTSAKHYDKDDHFAALYRDDIEIVVVQAQQGTVAPNRQRYGAGYDAYIDPATTEGVDPIYEEFAANGVKVVTPPHMTDYGSYEFVIEDIDGRLIGIGRIADKAVFFADSDMRDYQKYNFRQDLQD